MPFPHPLLSSLASIARRRAANAACAVAISAYDGVDVVSTMALCIGLVRTHPTVLDDILLGNLVRLWRTPFAARRAALFVVSGVIHKSNLSTA